MALFCPISGHLLSERSLAEIWVSEHPGEEIHLCKMRLKPASLQPVCFQVLGKDFQETLHHAAFLHLHSLRGYSVCEIPN